VRRLAVQIPLDAPRMDDGVVDEVLETAPDLVGLSCYCWDLDAQLRLASRLREAAPTTRIVLGGPSASYRSAELLRDNPAVDAVVRGEGEQTLLDIVERDDADLSGVPGVTWRGPGGEPRQEPDRPVAPDLAALPSPLLSGVLEPPRQNLMLELSRGCRYRCTYCAWKTHGGGVRAVPEARVRDELSWALDRGYEHAFVIDSALNDDDDRLAGIARAARAVDPERRLAHSYFVNHAFLSKGQVADLDSLRPHEVTIGLESLSPRAMKAAGRKPLDEDRFAAALDLLSEIAPATVSLMLGMPGDDLEGFRRTLDFVARLAERPGRPRVRFARAHWMLIAPGSYLWRRSDRYGLDIAPQGVPYVLGSESFPREDLIQALHLLHDHPRSDLFVWEDAEPLAMLDASLPELFAARGDRIGGRSGDRVEVEALRRALGPLGPGRPMPRGWSMAPLDMGGGYPTVRIEGPDGRRLALQARPAGAEPHPYARTRTFDLVALPPEGSGDGSSDPTMLGLLVEVIRRNEA